MENVLPGIKREYFWRDLSEGQGDELRSKFCSVASSSALAVNSFAPWKCGDSIKDLSILEFKGFHCLKFERQMQNGLKGTKPHLDVLLKSENLVLGIESKFLEILSETKPVFSDNYFKINDHRKTSKWFQAMELIVNGEASFTRLDAAQLIKHFFGICYKKSTEKRVLLYLFWEPVNASEQQEYIKHRQELDDFSKMVAGNNLLEFRHLSYTKLWAQWENIPAMAEHCKNLQARYLIEI